MTLIDREPRPASGSPTPADGTANADASAKTNRPRPSPLGDAPVDRWKGAPRPTTPAAWIARAREGADILAVDQVERDRAGASPHQEVALLKHAGLVTLLGPAEHGGGGQTWETAYQVIRAVARGDGSIGQLLGYHYLWAWAARLVATDAQIEAVEKLATTGNLLFGGAVNPRDSDLVIREDGDDLIFSGRKSFSTGGVVSDLTVLEGALETAAAYTRSTTRAWPYGGDDKERATDEWYVLEGYGQLQSKLWASEALLGRVGAEISAVLHAPRERLTERKRGEIAVRVAAAKARIVEDGLEVGTRVFELTGARATASTVGLDVYWRNLRTHSLHDPAPYKKREVGQYVLLNEVPEPSWYT